ncbi:MAG: alpha/beta fold hydrolase [Sediminibacterium sp.]|jgi:hypothetical protein|nr:alpha/beta fold hydrolase [Sediminibacterium sp.]
MKKIIKTFLLLVLIANASISQKVPCTPKYLPVVLVHGFLGGGDNWTSLYQDLISNGFCRDQVYVFDWNSTSGNNTAQVPLLDSFIQTVLSKHEVKQVNLIGHSAGGGLSYSYCSDKMRAAKIARYIHIGSSKMKSTVGQGKIPMLNIYSKDDMVVKTGGDIDGAINLGFEKMDHFEIITHSQTARAVVEFFRNTDTDMSRLPPIETIPYHKNLNISGKAVTFGDNKPLAGATIEIYAIRTNTGQRISKKADAKFISDELGYWGTFKAKPFTSYEIVLRPADTSMRTIYYYRDIFIAENPLVYLRALPKSGLPALLLGNLPKKEEQSVIAIFSGSKAMIHGRDSVTVENRTLTTAELSPASKTAIAHFLYDNGDQKTSGMPHAAFGSTPFLAASDQSFPTKPVKPIQIYFNTRKLAIPNRSSRDGLMVVIFD